MFVGGGRSSIEVGTNGLIALIAYPAARPIVSLLQRLCEPAAPHDPKWTALAEART